MNLYFLVEGKRTEKKVYAHWVAHGFPQLSQVHSLSEVADNHYIIISGGGQPAILDEIGAALANIRDRPVFDALFICVDTEEDDYDAKVAEVEAEVARWRRETGVDARAPDLDIHVIVQHCCIETWFLGHAKMMHPHPSSPELARYKAFYDVRISDPELMGSMERGLPRAMFHGMYLKAMLQERSPKMHYSKQRPGVVMEKEYMDALRERCQTTGHLRSLQRLFTAWDELAGR